MLGSHFPISECGNQFQKAEIETYGIEGEGEGEVYTYIVYLVLWMRWPEMSQIIALFYNLAASPNIDVDPNAFSDYYMVSLYEILFKK